MILHLSCWVERVIGIHEGAQVGQTGGEVGQGIETQPGEQQTGTDEGLQEQAQIVESVFPAGIVGPGRVLQGGSRRGGLRRIGGRGRQGRSLQTHEQIGAHHQLPPALDTGGIGEAEIGPAEFIFGLFKSIFYPGS